MDETDRAKNSKQPMPGKEMVVYEEKGNYEKNLGIVYDDLVMEMIPTLEQRPAENSGKEDETNSGTIPEQPQQTYKKIKDEHLISREVGEKKEETGSRRRSQAEDGRMTAETYKDFHDLYLASINGDLDDFLRILRRLSPESSARIPHSPFPGGNTLLHVAAKHGNQDIAKFIADRNPSLVCDKNANGDTALHLAARGGDEEMVRALVGIQSGSLMEENEMGNTALHEALINGRDSTARFLIQRDPEMSYRLNRSRESAFYLASKGGFLGCVSSMLALCTDERRLHEAFKYKSPVQAAIETKNRGT